MENAENPLIAQCLELHARMNRPDFDYYALLGLDRTATVAAITEAHEKWARALASDMLARIQSPDVRRRVQEVRRRMDRAFAVLSDFEQRAAYEQRGFREVSEVDPGEGDPQEKARELFRKAKTLYAQKQFGPAILALKEAEKLDPERADQLLLLGLCQYRSPAMKREAESNLQKAAELEPWNAEPLVALGNLFYSEKLLTRAASFYRRALGLEPGHVQARRRLEEIAPERDTSIKSSLQSALRKGLPSIFGRKKN